MSKKIDNKKRNPGGIIVFPPIIPGGAAGSVIPPWLFPKPQGPYPPESGPYPPESGPYPPESGPYPPESGPYPPESGPYPPAYGPFPPIPPLPQEEDKYIVKIKSVYENQFVTVGQYGYLYASEDKYNQVGLFKIILNKNNVIIRQKGGNFIRLDNRNFLIADVDRRNATIFKLYSVDKEQYVLQAPNGRFVKVREKDGLLVAKGENLGPRTIFKFKIVE